MYMWLCAREQNTHVGDIRVPPRSTLLFGAVARVRFVGPLCLGSMYEYFTLQIEKKLG